MRSTPFKFMSDEEVLLEMGLHERDAPAGASPSGPPLDAAATPPPAQAGAGVNGAVLFPPPGAAISAQAAAGLTFAHIKRGDVAEGWTLVLKSAGCCRSRAEPAW